jgi:hypothetical protein
MALPDPRNAKKPKHFVCRDAKEDQGVIYVLGVAQLSPEEREQQLRDGLAYFWVAQPDFAKPDKEFGLEMLTDPVPINARDTEIQADIDTNLLEHRDRDITYGEALRIWEQLRPHIKDNECTTRRKGKNDRQSILIDGRWFSRNLFEEAELERVLTLTVDKEQEYREKLEAWIERNFPEQMPRDLERQELELEDPGLGLSKKQIKTLHARKGHKHQKRIIIEESETEAKEEGEGEEEEEGESQGEQGGASAEEEKREREAEQAREIFGRFTELRKRGRWPHSLEALHLRVINAGKELRPEEVAKMNAFIDEFRSKVDPAYTEAEKLLSKLKSHANTVTEGDNTRMAELAREYASSLMDAIWKEWQTGYAALAVMNLYQEELRLSASGRHLAQEDLVKLLEGLPLLREKMEKVDTKLVEAYIRKLLEGNARLAALADNAALAMPEDAEEAAALHKQLRSPSTDLDYERFKALYLPPFMATPLERESSLDVTTFDVMDVDIAPRRREEALEGSSEGSVSAGEGPEEVQLEAFD